MHVHDGVQDIMVMNEKKVPERAKLLQHLIQGIA